MFKQFRIWGTTDHVYIDADVQQSVKLNADGFFKALLTLPSRRCLDLLRVAASIHAVDRISKRMRRRDNEDGIRQLHLTFEVRDIEFWRQSDIKQLLTEILSFLTDDDWTFDFDQARRANGDLGHQDFLDLPRPFQPRHAALFSGGLDSAAGLANRLLAGANDFMLVTVGHQSGLHRHVDKQLKGLRSLLEGTQGMTVDLLHSTLTTSLEGGKSKRMRQQERTQRSRAFLFCSAAAIAAKAYSLETIEMFENGVGAINLPLMTGMLGSGHATRGGHPVFLNLMSELSAHVTEKSMRFVLPFETKTKAEMLQELKACPGLTRWAQESRSCAHTSLRQAGKTHCGRCPACIERRQAFASADIDESLDIYQTDALTESLSDQDEADYLRLYRIEAMKWLEGEESARRRMANHLRLTNVPYECDERISELQSRHSREVLRTFGHAFLSQDKSIPRTTGNTVIGSGEIQ